MKSNQLSAQGRTIRDYVYSSQTKNRDQFTLKNILDLDADYQRNFISQNSQRLIKTAPRPHTMYGDRLRIKLIDDNKNNKNYSQMKINRYSSSKILRSNSNTDQKKVSQEEKMKMKKAIGKISILADGNSLNIKQDEQLTAIFHFLECLAKISNHYQENFVYLSQRLKCFIFANCKQQLLQKARSITSLWKNQFLEKFAYRQMQNTTYENLCNELFNIFIDLHKKMEALQKSEAETQLSYKKQLQQKQETILKLKRQLKYYSEHPSQDLYPYIRTLERKSEDSKQQIQKLANVKDDNQYRIQIFENTNLLLGEQIQTLKTKIYEFQLAQLSGANQIEKSSELREFQNNINMLKDMLEKSKLKMQKMKEEYDKLREYNDQLINERSVLAKRAAVGYGQLTPRPNIQQLFETNLLDYNRFFHSKEKYSTEKGVQILVQAMKLIPKEELKQKKKKRKQHKQKHEEKDIANDVIEHLNNTKQQITKTKVSVDVVKAEYNRQLKEKEALQRNRNKKQ